MRNIISTILLTVYSIVLGHNFVPHHHHSEDSHNPAFYCQVEEEQFKESCCNFSLTNHGHDSHQHQPCNFNEKFVPAKKSSGLSVLFLPATPVEYEFSDQEKKVFYGNYITKNLTDRNSRYILLRGPPQLS